MRTTKKFKIGYISNVFIEKELKNLKRKKSAGIDDLPPGILKDCAKNIWKPLCYIINLSIKKGQVPKLWKIAKVT